LHWRKQVHNVIEAKLGGYRTNQNSTCRKIVKIVFVYLSTNCVRKFLAQNQDGTKNIERTNWFTLTNKECRISGCLAQRVRFISINIHWSVIYFQQSYGTWRDKYSLWRIHSATTQLNRIIFTSLRHNLSLK
jgi:hypothetical protein